MVHRAAADEQERLRHGVLAGGRELGVGRRLDPGVGLAVDNGEARVADGVAAMLVDGLDVGRGRDIEGLAADDGLVLEVDQAAEDGLLRWGYVGCLEVAPSVNGGLVFGPVLWGVFLHRNATRDPKRRAL